MPKFRLLANSGHQTLSPKSTVLHLDNKSKKHTRAISYGGLFRIDIVISRNSTSRLKIHPLFPASSKCFALSSKRCKSSWYSSSLHHTPQESRSLQRGCGLAFLWQGSPLRRGARGGSPLRREEGSPGIGNFGGSVQRAFAGKTSISLAYVPPPRQGPPPVIRRPRGGRLGKC